MTPLRQRMAHDMQVRNLAVRTQGLYIGHVERFAKHFGRSPHLLGREEIRSYQVFLIQKRQLSPSTLAIAVAALRFLYRVTLQRDWNCNDVIPVPKQPKKLPVVPSAEQVATLLHCIASPMCHAIFTACYAAGLRISEAVNLRPAHVDSQRMVLRIEHGKGAKDRYVMLSPRLLDVLREYWRRTRPQGKWLFPGRVAGRHISTKSAHAAFRRGWLRSGRSKRLSPHSLRHYSESRIIPSCLPEIGGARALRDIGLGIITERSGTPELRLRGGIASEGCSRGWCEPSPFL